MHTDIRLHAQSMPASALPSHMYTCVCLCCPAPSRVRRALLCVTVWWLGLLIDRVVLCVLLTGVIKAVGSHGSRVDVWQVWHHWPASEHGHRLVRGECSSRCSPLFFWVRKRSKRCAPNDVCATAIRAKPILHGLHISDEFLLCLGGLLGGMYGPGL